MTCRLFIDECGNADLKGAADDPNVRYLSLTGIVMKSAAHARRLQPALEALKAVHFGEPGDNSVILHRREIMRREGCFSVLRDPDRREAFDADLLALVEEQPFQAITVTIDKKEHLERYRVWRFDPYHYCLTCLVERYVQWMDRHDLTGDVVIEARFKKVDKKLKASFSRLWHEGTDRVPARIMQARLLSKDIGMYVKAANIAGLQLCDLIAYPSYRDMRKTRDGEKRPDDFGTRIADLLIEKKYARNPRNRRIEGWGTKWLP
jgi:hypothetical protein